MSGGHAFLDFSLELVKKHLPCLHVCGHLPRKQEGRHCELHAACWWALLFFSLVPFPREGKKE